VNVQSRYLIAPLSVIVGSLDFEGIISARKIKKLYLGADAILGGHTHGGQVCLPGYGALVANCDIPLKQAKGLSTWTHDGRSVPLNVSAGCGHSIYAPVRFACRPEATLLTLIPHA